VIVTHFLAGNISIIHNFPYQGGVGLDNIARARAAPPTLSGKSPRKTGFIASQCRALSCNFHLTARRPLYSGRICRISAKFFESTTEHITPHIFVLFTTHDRRFLQQNSEEAREDRICTEDGSPHRPVLLYFYAVFARTDGANRGPVPGIGLFYHRFREIFSGRPGRYDLTRLF